MVDVIRTVALNDSLHLSVIRGLEQIYVSGRFALRG